jgi:exonuclease SbcD
VDKRVLLVEFANTPDGVHVNHEPQFTPKLTSIPIPRFQPMQELQGKIDEIKAQLLTYPLVSEAGTALPTWLLIKLTDANSIQNVANTIAEFAQDRHVVITKIIRIRSPQEQALRTQHNEVLTQLTPSDVFAKRLESETELSDAQRAQLNSTFHDIISKVTTGTPLDDVTVSEESLI